MRSVSFLLARLLLTLGGMPVMRRQMRLARIKDKPGVITLQAMLLQPLTLWRIGVTVRPQTGRGAVGG